MRKRFLTAVLAAAVVAVAVVAAAPGAPSPAERTQQARARAVLAEITNLDARMEHVVNAWDEANVRLASLDGQVRTNRIALRHARTQLRIARARLARRLVYVYENGEPTFTDVLIGARSFTQLVDRIQAAEELLQEDNQIAGAARTASRRFAHRQRSLARAETQQRATVTQLASARSTIEQTLAQRRSLLSSVRTQIAQLQARQRAHERYLAAAARAQIAQASRERAARAARVARAHTARPAAPSTARIASRPSTPAPAPAPAPKPAPAPATPAPPSAPLPQPTGGGHPQAASIAARYLGVAYRWGGASPSTGFDCSGLVMYVYAQLGISLPHYTGAQWSAGIPVARSQLEPGDLVFFDSLGHVGIYIGGDRFIHAPHTGDVVRVSSLSESWYASHYDGARRIP